MHPSKQDHNLWTSSGKVKIAQLKKSILVLLEEIWRNSCQISKYIQSAKPCPSKDEKTEDFCQKTKDKGHSSIFQRSKKHEITLITCYSPIYNQFLLNQKGESPALIVCQKTDNREIMCSSDHQAQSYPIHWVIWHRYLVNINDESSNYNDNNDGSDITNITQ